MEEVMKIVMLKTTIGTRMTMIKTAIRAKPLLFKESPFQRESDGAPEERHRFKIAPYS
jgi:hypothetical protein